MNIFIIYIHMKKFLFAIWILLWFFISTSIANWQFLGNYDTNLEECIMKCGTWYKIKNWWIFLQRCNSFGLHWDDVYWPRWYRCSKKYVWEYLDLDDHIEDVNWYRTLLWMWIKDADPDEKWYKIPDNKISKQNSIYNYFKHTNIFWIVWWAILILSIFWYVYMHNKQNIQVSNTDLESKKENIDRFG